MDQPLIWIDLETTGLNAREDKILEIAVVATDGNLAVAQLGPNLVVHHEVSDLVMDEYVRNMHTKNGLLADLPGGVALEDAERQVLAWVSQFAEPQTVPMAGSSIHFDRRFIEEHMPTLLEWFHHRVVDVSSFNECWERWAPHQKLKAPESRDTHRAQADILDSIERLRFYHGQVLMTKLREMF